MRSLLIYFLFFVSGISGLVYQVTWVRQFGNVFGNTVYSAATVSGVFLLSLGLGSFAAGRWSDRRQRGDPRAPLRAYGRFELAIALLGLAIAWVLPSLEALSAAAAAYTRGPEGWYELTATSYLVRYAVAVALLAPITLLMGGTLTLLIRHLVARDLPAAGVRIGALYGINTAGAALGAFLSDFALIPALGVFDTQLVAVAGNAVAGTGALWLARSLPAPAGAAPARAAPVASPPGHRARRQMNYTAAALFLSGLAAMGMQIVWFRFLIGVIGAYRSVFSLLLTVILLGIFLGSVLGGVVQRRLGRPALLYLVAQAGFLLSTLWAFVRFEPGYLGHLADAYAALGNVSPLSQLLAATWFNLRPILDLVALPAILMGVAYPLANAHVQQFEDRVGGRAGALYLANTLGNLVGSLVTGFALLPWFGSARSVAVLVACATLGLLPLYLSMRGHPAYARRPRLPAAVFAAALAALLVCLAGWVRMPPLRLILPTLSRTLAGGGTLETVSEGINETLAIVDNPGAVRILITNGHPMSSTSPTSNRYMRLFSHVPLLLMDAPRRVLVICYGVGNTVYAATLHPSVERVEAVDLSKNVIAHAAYFNRYNEGVIDSPKLSVYINDGRQHLRMRPPGTYDLITLEPPPPPFAGVASLYSRDFYALARQRLVEGGYLTQWLPFYQLSGDDDLSAIRAFIDVFPASVLLVGAARELILVGVKGDVLELDPRAVLARVAAAPRVRRDLRRIEVESLTTLVGTFGADRLTLERATRDVAPITDDWPVTEYSIHSNLVRTRFPETVLDVQGVRRWCPRCFENGRPIPELADLPAYLGALDACYRSERFRSFTVLRSRTGDGSGGAPPALPPDGDVTAAIRHHPYLFRTFLARGAPNPDVRAQIAPCHLESPPPALRGSARPGPEAFRSPWPGAP